MTTTTADGRPVWAWRLKSARDWTGMSQSAWAAALTERVGRKISGQVVYNLESGKTRADVDVLIAVSDLTGLPVEWVTADPFVTPRYHDHPADLREDDGSPLAMAA